MPETTAVPENGASFPVVGVGASAGGLEALRKLLGALPRDTGMGFVIVQHLAPDHASSLVEILARATKMPVREVRDEPAVEPDHVYVIPPGRDMIIAGGKLRLLPQERNARHRGIDQFFRSLAEDSRHQAIGVVLSGSASDGTLGLEVIKAEGGVTFAQDETAQHDSMPKSAVASGCVDFVLPPEDIAREIARIARHPYIAVPPEEDGGGEEGVGHGRIAEIVRWATGVDFTHYKANTMQRRIERRMMVHKIETLAEYEGHLRANPGEVEALYQDVLINVTSFFRNPEAFETLAKKVFPKLLADRTRHEPVRMWTLGCSTGEEAYSLAMLFAECAEAAKSSARLQLFATDINATGIEKARVGRYPLSISQDVSPERLRKFFVEEDGHYRVNKTIRECIVFSRHNVLADPPFSRVDFISCRNLLIYLEPVLQEQVMPLLHYALKPGGHLWLGSAESPGTSRELFEVEDARQKIFTRRPGPTPLVPSFRGARSTAIFPAAPPAPRETPQTTLHRDAERVLLAKYAPPGVVVNARLEVVQFRGETGAYLAPAAGLASHELLKMLREGLLMPVRAALSRAESEGSAVREEGARVKSNGGHRELAIEVIPLKAGPGHEAGFVVLFDEGARTPAHSSHGTDEKNETDDSELARLTQELAATRAYLQSVIEQQDAANEELQSANEEAQSANEEMQSVNEELQTSKEEIESSSEELQTVNDELNNRNVELSGLNNDLNNDLNNVLTSTHLSIVLVTRDLRIRRFTAMAKNTLQLTGSDQGRPLSDIKLSIALPELGPLLLEVIDTISPRERDVQDAEGHWFSLRARPYLTHDNKIDGAVVTLVDVDELRRARLYAEDLLAHAPVPVVVLDSALRVKTASRAFFETYHVAPTETVDRPIYELGNRQWDIPALRTLLEEVLPREVTIKNFEVRHTFEEIGARIMLLNARRLAQAADNEPLIILSIEDITARERAQQALVEKSRLLDLTNDAIIVRDMEGRIAFWNAGAEKLYGWPREEALGKMSHALLKTESSVPFEQITEELHRDGHWTGEFVHTKRDGGRITVLARKSLDRDSQGNPAAILVTLTDITERKRIEAAVSEGEQRFRALVENIAQLAWTANPDGYIHWYNQRWYDYTGSTPQEMEGWGWQSVHDPQQLPRVLEQWKASIATGKPFEMVFPLRGADGQFRPFLTRVHSIKDAEGRVVQWIGTNTDVGELTRAEAALRQSEERHRALITASSDVVYRMSADWSELAPIDGRNLVASSATASRTWLEDNVFPEDRPQIRAAFEEAIRTKGVFNLEHRIRRADGTAGWTVSRAVPLLDANGEIVEWFGTANDVTERRQAEEALRASEARKNAILDSALDAIITMDHEGRLVEFNGAAERIFGYARAEVLGRELAAIIIPERLRERHQQGLARFLATGEWPVLNKQIELPALRADGTEFPAEIAIIAIPGTQPPLFTAFLRDVTERRALEETLLARADQLAQADRRKDEFLAMLAHELRNPLAPLRNAAELLKADDASADERAQAQRVIDRQIENMSRMLEDLLDVSRITAGKITLRKKPVPLEGILTAATSLVRSTCAAHQQHLAVSLPKEPVYLDADATRLEQVFGNLLNNACKYSGDGCHISIHAERVRDAEPPEVIVTVRDDGAGIDPELLPRIFDLFVQASRTLDRSHGGLGIGLTLVQRLVKLHGGSIEAHSEGLGHGAEFVVRLPILTKAPLPEPLPAESLAHASPGTPRRILIVDDNTDSARSLATLQKRRGHETRTAFTGPDAVTAAAEFLPDVVLLDIGLPGMDGFEVARKIRAIPALAGALLIAMSGYGREEDRAEAKRAGFDEYMVKPVDLEILHAWLQNRSRS